MNAFARGNVASARKYIAQAERDLEDLRRRLGRLGEKPPHELGYIEIDLRNAREVLENAVTLDDMTEERKTG